MIYDELVACELERDFRDDVQHCVPFRADEDDARKTSDRLVDSVMRLGSPLIWGRLREYCALR